MFRRPLKESHIDTIQYEIDMLRFCLSKLKNEPPNSTEADRNLHIEGFLLHYRNLIQFFEGKGRHGDELRISDPKVWSEDDGASEGEIQWYVARAQPLMDQHWDDLSRYLQHCTTMRCERSKEWDVDAMYAAVNELLERFETAFIKRPNVRIRGQQIGAVGTQTVVRFNEE